MKSLITSPNQRRGLAAMLSLILATAQGFASEAVLGANDHTLVPDPALVSTVASNGLRIHALANTRPEGNVTVLLRIPHGAGSDPGERAGLAHLTEHLFFRNRAGDSSQSIAEKLRSIGLQDGSGMNAHTTPTYTQIEFHFQADDADKLADVFKVLRQALSGWVVTADDFAREVKIVQQEIRTREEPGLALARETHAVLFADTPHERVDAAGCIRSVANILPDDVAAFFKWAYEPGNILLVIVGDIDAGLAAEAANLHLGVVPAGIQSPLAFVDDAPTVPYESSRETILQSPTKSGAEIVIAWPFTARALVTAADVRSRLVEAIATRSIDNRMRALQDDSPQVLLANAGVQNEVPGLRFLAGLAIDDNWQRLLKILVSALPPNGEVSNSEIDTAIRQIQSQIEAPLEAADTTELANILIKNLSDGSVPVSDADMQSLLVALLPTISPAEVKAEIAQFAKLETARYVVTLPKETAVESEAVGEVVALALESSAQADRSNTPNLSSQEFEPTEIPKAAEGMVLEFDSVALADKMLWTGSTSAGVAVAWMTDPKITNDRFYLRLTFVGGKQSESATTQGALSLLAFHLARGGRAIADSTNFDAWLEKHQIAFRVEAETDVLALMLDGPESALPSALQLLYHLLSSNELPSDQTVRRWAAFEHMLNANRFADPSKIVAARLRSLLFPKDISAREISSEQLSAIDGKESGAVWNKLRRDAGARLAIVTGELNRPEEMLRHAVGALSALRTRAGAEEALVKSQPQSPNTTHVDSVDNPIANQVLEGASNSEVRVVFATPASEDPLDRAAAEIRAELFCLRLKQELREDLGLSYEQRARLTPSQIDPATWFLVVSVSCKPSTAEEVKKRIKALAENLDHSYLVSMDEWNIAYQAWKTGTNRRLDNPRAWVSELSKPTFKPDWIEFTLHASADSDTTSARVRERFDQIADLTPQLRLAVAFHPRKPAVRHEL